MHFGYRDRLTERVVVIAAAYPEILNTHKGTMLRLRGKITKVSEFAVHVEADEVIFTEMATVI